jgi:hypothetical protein
MAGFNCKCTSLQFCARTARNIRDLTKYWTRGATAGSLGAGGREVSAIAQLDRLAAGHESSPAEERDTHRRVHGPQTRRRSKPLRRDCTEALIDKQHRMIIVPHAAASGMHLRSHTAIRPFFRSRHRFQPMSEASVARRRRGSPCADEAGRKQPTTARLPPGGHRQCKTPLPAGLSDHGSVVPSLCLARQRSRRRRFGATHRPPNPLRRVTPTLQMARRRPRAL